MPRLAATKSPGLVCTAVVKAPRTCPKSWLSSSVSGIAPQLSAMNSRSARQLAAWIARAASSLPTPLSPEMSTPLGVRAQRAIFSRTA